MKKIIIMLISILLVGCTTSNDIARFKEEYEALNDENIKVIVDEEVVVNYVDEKETYDFLTNGTGIIYFGLANSHECRNVVPSLFEVAKENNLVVNYYDTNRFSSKGDEEIETETFSKIIELLYYHLKEDTEGNKVLFVPDVYYVKDGEIIDHHLGTIDKKEDSTVALNEEEKKKLFDIYHQLINKD